MGTIIQTGVQWVRSGVGAVLPKFTRRWIRHVQRKSIACYRTFTMDRKEFKNREGFQNFNFTLFQSNERDGVSAMLRVKNEEAKIYYCLSSIIDVFDEIIFVDNGSQDRTVEIAREFKEREDPNGKVQILSYPFRISRCGPEHFATPEDSVNNLSYYYNWTLSKCSFRYVCKWDADMVLRRQTKEQLKRFFVEIQSDERKCWRFYGQTIYQDEKGDIYLAKEEINSEIQLFPYGFNPRFHKIDLFEALVADPPVPVDEFRGVAFYELKFATEDEFSHWSVATIPTERKQRELKNFHLIRMGEFTRSQFERLPHSFLREQVSL